MNIATWLDALAATIRADEALAAVRLVHAYPAATAPSILQQSVIAIGLADVQLDAFEIGSAQQAGALTLFADIYVPLQAESKTAYALFAQLCRALQSMQLRAVCAERICVDAHTQAYVLKTRLTLKAMPVQGGEGGA